MTQTTMQPATPGAPSGRPGGSPRPRSPFMTYFMPGLVLGLVIGAFAGAVVPTLVGADQATLRPVAGSGSETQPPMSRAEREAAEAAAEHLRLRSVEEAEAQVEAAPADTVPTDAETVGAESEAVDPAPAPETPPAP